MQCSAMIRVGIGVYGYFLECLSSGNHFGNLGLLWCVYSHRVYESSVRSSRSVTEVLFSIRTIKLCQNYNIKTISWVDHSAKMNVARRTCQSCFWPLMETNTRPQSIWAQFHVFWIHTFHIYAVYFWRLIPCKNLRSKSDLQTRFVIK